MCAGNNRFFPFCCHSDFAVISEYYETLGICPEAGPRGQISTPDPREQISPPGPRRFAPAEAPKFVSSIQLMRRAEAGTPIPAARSPITSKSARFVDLGGNSDGIHALLAAHLPPITSNFARIADLGGNVARVLKSKFLRRVLVASAPAEAPEFVSSIQSTLGSSS